MCPINAIERKRIVKINNEKQMSGTVAENAVCLRVQDPREKIYRVAMALSIKLPCTVTEHIIECIA